MVGPLKEAFLPYLTPLNVGLAVVVGLVVILLLRRGGKKKHVLITKKWDKDMVYLYVFPPTDLQGMSSSPPCLKLETFLVLSKIPYKVVPGDHLRKSPKGKLPFIEVNGKAIADSELVIAHLRKNKIGQDIDAHLDEQQKATTVAFTRLLYEHLYWVLVWSKWVEPIGKARAVPDFLKAIPAVLYPILKGVIVGSVEKNLYHAGMGRHSKSEILELADVDLRAISTLLGDNKFVFGDQPSSLDAAIFGILYNIFRPKFTFPLKELAGNYPNLNAYVKNFVDTVYTDKAYSARRI